MYPLNCLKKTVSLVFFTAVSMKVGAFGIQNEQQQTDQNITEFYQLLSKQSQDMPTRIEFVSAQLLGKPYLLGALGEGERGTFDQAPLYRTDAFDCETYVDTVLAIALAQDPLTFKQCIQQIRYREGKVSFINRNHFTCLDWNQNNQQQGFLKDITTAFHDGKNQPVSLFAQAVINKPAWYQRFSIDHIRINPPSVLEQEKRLEALKQKSKTLPVVTSTIPYIPLAALFDAAGNANHTLFNQIPNAAIVEIIRPNWNLEKEIGTHLNVSHLGFAVWKNGALFFRETSSKEGVVVDYPFIDYLRETRNSPTIKGINIQIVVPQQPLAAQCKLT